MQCSDIIEELCRRGYRLTQYTRWYPDRDGARFSCDASGPLRTDRHKSRSTLDADDALHRLAEGMKLTLTTEAAEMNR